MKNLKTITMGDGSSVQVDLNRFNAFDTLRELSTRIIGTEGRDAQEAMAFIVSQLTYTEAQTFERLYTPMQYEQLIPISHEAGEWAESIRYEIYDYAGRGKRTSGKGRDINKVDVAWADKTFPVVNGDIGYDYTTEELRRSAFLRKSLPERKLQAAIDGYRRHMNDVMLLGEDNLTGLFNNPNVPHGNAPNGSWLTTQAAAINTTGVNAILQDINSLITGVWVTTKQNDQITTIAIPSNLYAYIATTPRSANSDKTILEYVKEKNVAKLEKNIDIEFVSIVDILATAGVGNTNRIMGYVKSDQRLIGHIPLPLRFLAPQLVGLSVDIPGEYKYSGVEFRYPGSAYYMDGC